jgi:two-component system, OmpR family, heavy metal sensor histidine kinase CusS
MIPTARVSAGSASSTGLGLAIVRSIMDLHGGRASAENLEGCVRFSLFFPAIALQKHLSDGRLSGRLP